MGFLIRADDHRRSFFFSSRRRHTRCSRDWSSDVCSSDLVGAPALAKVTPKRLTDTIAHARRARIRDYVDCARLLVKAVAKETPPFRRTWPRREAVTHPGASGCPIRAVGRDRDTGR